MNIFSLERKHGQTQECKEGAMCNEKGDFESNIKLQRLGWGSTIQISGCLYNIVKVQVLILETLIETSI